MLLHQHCKSHLQFSKLMNEQFIFGKSLAFHGVSVSMSHTNKCHTYFRWVAWLHYKLIIQIHLKVQRINVLQQRIIHTAQSNVKMCRDVLE